MPYAFQVFPDPLDSTVTLRSDDGFNGTGVPHADSAGRPGQVIIVPNSIPSGHGSELTIEHADYQPLRVRGFLMLEGVTARLQVDDYRLTPVPVAPPTPEPPQPPSGQPNPNANPMDIINSVYAATHPNLATKVGCGTFTENCCEALHNQMHPAWGHVKKTGAQNQYNGHAVDAVMLLVPSGSTQPGIYDIITSSESADAKPAFNYAGPPDNSLWLYPPSPVVTEKGTPTAARRTAKK